MKYKLMFLWLFAMIVLLKCATAYTIVGDSVVEEDSMVYLSATPHTLIENGWVQFDFIPKTFTGSVNVVLGVNTEQMTPQKVVRWNFAQERWVDFNSAWSSVYRTLDGKNKWWYLQNVPVVAGTDYRIAVKFDISHNLTGKYDFGIYPSSYGADILTANSNGHLYYLDPWFNSSWLYCKEWNITENDGINRSMMVVQHNLTGLTLSNNATEIRVIDGSCYGGGDEVEYSLVKTDDTTWATVQYWVNISDSETKQYAVYYGNPSADNLLPYDTPPIMFEVNFPDGLNTTGDVNRTSPYYWQCGSNAVFTADYVTTNAYVNSAYCNWFLKDNFLYYSITDTFVYEKINFQWQNFYPDADWKAFVAPYFGTFGTGNEDYEFIDGYSITPSHFSSSASIVEYTATVGALIYSNTTGGAWTSLLHHNITTYSNGSIHFSTNETSSSFYFYDSTLATDEINKTGFRLRSNKGQAHSMRMTTGTLYGVEIGDDNLLLSVLSPQIAYGTDWNPSSINESIVETTGFVEQGWLSNNITGVNVSYNLTTIFNESCFDFSVNPSNFYINGSGNQSVNWSFNQYNNCSSGVYSGRTLIYIDDVYNDEIPILITVTDDNNTYTPQNFSMTINQGNLDTSYFNMSNGNSATNSTFTFTDNFDVFCFSKTYLPVTFDLDGVENEQLGFRIGVNPLCPNTTYYGNISVYDDGFFDATIEGTIIVTNITIPVTPVSSAGMNCSYSSQPYLRRTIDWVCLLNTSSDWYCYGSVFWNNNPTDLVSISPDSDEFEDVGLLDYQIVSGRILNMQFKNDDLYDNNLYNFTVECVSDITNQTASFSTTVIPSFVEPRSLIYRTVWFKDNATFLIVIVALSILVIVALGFIVRKVKG